MEQSQESRQEANPSNDASFVSVLRNRNFLLLWVAQLTSNLGDALARMALLIFITDQSDSALAISGLMMVQMLPMIALGPIIGVFVDRWDRKKILIFSDAARGALYLVIALHPEPLWVYVVVFLANLASLFFNPARGAIIPDLVGDEQLTAAIGLSQTTQQTVGILGPVMGGAMAGFFGAGAVFSFNAVTFFISALLIVMIAVPVSARFGAPALEQETPEEEAPLKRFGAQLAFGLRFLRGEPVLWFIVTMMGAFSVLAQFAGVGFLDYTRNVLDIDPTLFGTLMMVSGVGAALGALVMGNVGDRLHKGRSFYLSFVGQGLVWTLYFLQPSFTPLMAIALVSGILGSAFQVPLTAIFYSRTPVEVRGRVFSVTNSLMNGAGLLSLAVVGLVIGALGSAVTIGLMGALSLVFALAMLRLPGSKVLLAPEKKAGVDLASLGQVSGPSDI